MKKTIAAALCFLQLLWWLPAGQAEAITQKPEPLRIPPHIQLLEDTPFYDNVETDYPNHPAGIISPQDVEVLEGQNGWVNERNRWKIRTWLGDKWIVTEPGTFDVPPPEQVTLLQETPIYGSPNAKEEPNAVLSPQEVQVVGAGKQWFQVKDGTEPVWLKISTSWLGDQWIHVPLGSVGYLRKTDRRTYLMYAEVYDSPPVRYLQAVQVGKLENRYAHVTGEYVTPFGKAYRVETDIGEKWISEPGMDIEAIHEYLTLPSEVALFDSFLDNAAQLGTVEPQTVTAVEKVGSDPNGIGVWYHVLTSQGEGWINRSLGEPEHSVPAVLDIRLHTQTSLYQYPNARMLKAYEPLAAQTVRTDAYWNDPDGSTWFRTQSYAGRAWFRIDPQFDRLTVPDGKPRLQVSFQTLSALPYVQSGETLTDYGSKPIGFVRSGVHYLSVSSVADALRYKLSSPDPDGWVTLTPETRYAFKIKEGADTAVTLWNGRQQRTVKLQSAPELENGVLYLRSEDVQTLFGAVWTKDDAAPVFFLAAKAYTVEAPDWPAQAAAGSPLEIKAYALDQVRKGETLYPQLSLSRRTSAEAAGALPSNREDTGMRFAVASLYELSAAQPLIQGDNEFTAALKIGERIVWQQEFEVTAK